MMKKDLTNYREHSGTLERHAVITLVKEDSNTGEKELHAVRVSKQLISDQIV